MPATLAENAPAYAVVGSALSFSGFMIRRWIGRMDDAMEAYERGRREGEAINAARIARLEVDTERMRGALSRMLAELSDFPSMTPERFAQLRAEALKDLFHIDPTEDRQ
jgi:hypothetical protein